MDGVDLIFLSRQWRPPYSSINLTTDQFLTDFDHCLCVGTTLPKGKSKNRSVSSFAAVRRRTNFSFEISKNETVWFAESWKLPPAPHHGWVLQSNFWVFFSLLSFPTCDCLCCPSPLTRGRLSCACGYLGSECESKVTGKVESFWLSDLIFAARMMNRRISCWGLLVFGCYADVLPWTRLSVSPR